MATVDQFDAHALGPERILVSGSFRPQSTSALVAADTAPQRYAGFTVARSGAGLFTVTFNEAYYDLQSCFVSVREAAGTPTFAQGGDYSKANKTLQIRVMQESGGTLSATDLADDVDNRVSFLCIFINIASGAVAT